MYIIEYINPEYRNNHNLREIEVDYDVESIFYMEERIIKKWSTLLKMYYDSDTIKIDDTFTEADHSTIVYMFTQILYKLNMKPEVLRKITPYMKKGGRYMTDYIEIKKGNTTIDCSVQYCPQRHAYLISTNLEIITPDHVEDIINESSISYFDISHMQSGKVYLDKTTDIKKSTTWHFIPEGTIENAWYILSSCKRYILYFIVKNDCIVSKINCRKKNIRETPGEYYTIISSPKPLEVDNIVIET